MEEILADPKQPVFVTVSTEGGRCGLLEISIRMEAEGCTTNPIGNLEGWYVDSDTHGMSIGRKLVEAEEQWARKQGCSEMKSDTTFDYPHSPEAHSQLGFQEAKRTIHFWKEL